MQPAGYSVSLLCLKPGLLLLAAMCQLPGPLAAAESDLYGGRPLSEWRELIKSRPIPSLGTPEIVDGLLEIVKDPAAPWADRRQSALMLGRIGLPAKQAVPVLVELLHNQEADPQATQLWALRGLSLFGLVAEEATASVAELVSDSSQPVLVRISAMETLAQVGVERAEPLPTLVQFLRPDPLTGQLPPRELREAAAETIGLLGAAASAALPELIQAARDESDRLRENAVRSIAKTGPAAQIAVPTLVDMLLFDPVESLRELAAQSLAQIGDQGLSALQQLTRDDTEDVRRLAVRGLAEATDFAKAANILQTTLNDQSSLVRVQSAAALARREKTATPEVGEVLIQSLSDEDRNVRYAAYRALEDHPSQIAAYRERLERMAHDTSLPEQTRVIARRLLDQIPL